MRSIRVRLTIWYVAILAGILLLLSFGVYFALRRTLNDNLNDSLRTRATLIEGALEYDAAGAPALDLPTNARDPNLADTFQRIFDVSGRLIFDNSQTFGAGPANADDLNQALAKGDQLTTRGAGSAEARTLTRPLKRGDEVVGVLQVGQSTSDLNDTLDNLVLTLLVGCPIALVLAAVGGSWLASRALSPIDSVTRAAQEITAHDLSRRLALDLADDEVGRLAQTFDEMIERLEAGFQRERRFTADASHELRTPLTAMRGQIDVALERPRDLETYRHVLAIVNDQVDHMVRLVGGLLMLARADAGALALEHKPVAVEPLVEAVVEQVRPLAAAKGLKVGVDEGAAATVVGDEDLLLQLLLNLADNAVKYTDSGVITIGWTTRSTGVDLFVRDTGPGISAAHRELVFERFHRVGEQHGAGQNGAGLGLAICKWIVEVQGGVLALDSNAAGSKFTAAFPN